MSVKVDQIIRTERKSTEISVSVEGYIIVRAPLGEPIEKIEEIIAVSYTHLTLPTKRIV